MKILIGSVLLFVFMFSGYAQSSLKPVHSDEPSRYVIISMNDGTNEDDIKKVASLFSSPRGYCVYTSLWQS